MKNHNEYIGGIPDVWYSGHHNDLWVEYKYLPISTPRDPVIPNLSRKQLYWIIARRAEGRNIWVIVGYKRGGVIYKNLYDMQHGLPPDVFLDRTLTRKQLAEEIDFFCSAEKSVAGDALQRNPQEGGIPGDKEAKPEG